MDQRLSVHPLLDNKGAQTTLRGLSREVLRRRTAALADLRKAQAIDPADEISKGRLWVRGN